VGKVGQVVGIVGKGLRERICFMFVSFWVTVSKG
jgi:hypothetical protein